LDNEQFQRADLGGKRLEVAEAAVAEATTVAEATVAEAAVAEAAVPEAAVAEAAVSEAAVPEATVAEAAVAEADTAIPEVEELSVGLSGRAEVQPRGPRLDINIGGVGVLGRAERGK
jgi:hypothetical protein